MGRTAANAPRARAAEGAHHLTVGILAESRGELDGAHEHKKQAQRERQGHNRYGPRRGHLLPASMQPDASPLKPMGAGLGGSIRGMGFRISRKNGAGVVPVCSVPHPGAGGRRYQLRLDKEQF